MRNNINISGLSEIIKFLKNPQAVAMIDECQFLPEELVKFAEDGGKKEKLLRSYLLKHFSDLGLEQNFR